MHLTIPKFVQENARRVCRSTFSILKKMKYFLRAQRYTIKISFLGAAKSEMKVHQIHRLRAYALCKHAAHVIMRAVVVAIRKVRALPLGGGGQYMGMVCKKHMWKNRVKYAKENYATASDAARGIH